MVDRKHKQSAKKSKSAALSPQAGLPFWVWAAGLTVLVGLFVYFNAGRGGRALSKQSAGAGDSTPDISMDRLLIQDEEIYKQYAGSASCQECHASEFEQWKPSNHRMAERPLMAEFDVEAFDPDQGFEVASIKSTAKKEADTHIIETLGVGGTNQVHRLERVIGHTPLRQYLTDIGNGRLQAMDTSYDPHHHEWFNVYGEEGRQAGEWGHWTGRGMNWNSMCAGCHNTRLRKNYDPETDQYHTAMAEMSVGCESCHGPLKAHVQYYKSPETYEKPPKAPLGDRDASQILDTRGSCHSRRTELTGDFVPGESYLDHYSLVIPDASDLYYADGQVRDEDYVYTSFLSSKMHQSGVHCLDCHNPHSNETILPGNALCMRCHSGGYPKSPVIDPAKHMFHPSDTPGGNCVDCHMPQTTYMQRHPRRDHGFTIPDPLLTKELGIPNACNRCHEDQTTDWAITKVDEWYGERMERPTRDRARWIAQARLSTEGSHKPLLKMLKDEQTPDFWKAVSARLLDSWWFERDVIPSMIGASTSTNALLRSQVVMALGPAVRAGNTDAAQALVDRLEDPVRSVRVNAAWSLRSHVDPASVTGQELQHFLNLHLDQPSGQMQKGAWHLGQQDETSALKHYRKAVEWDPNSAPLRHELAVVFSMIGDQQSALKEIQEACRLDPTEGEYFYKQGLAWNELGKSGKVIESLKMAVQVDPRHSRAWYNLGLAQNGKGMREDALSSLIRGESANPFDPQIPYARATILMGEGRLEDAKRAAQRALEIQPDYDAARELLKNVGRF